MSRNRWIWCLTGNLFLCLNLGIAQEIPVVFYADTIRLADLEVAEAAAVPAQLSPAKIKRSSRKAQGCLSARWLDQIRRTQEDYRLNDWLLYRLLQRYFLELPGNLTENGVEISAQAVLQALGIESRLAYWQDQVFIYAASEEEVYDVPYIESGGKVFYNVTYQARNMQMSLPQIYLLENEIKTEGRQFSFDLTTPPRLRPTPVKKRNCVQARGHRTKVALLGGQKC